MPKIVDIISIFAQVQNKVFFDLLWQKPCHEIRWSDQEYHVG